MAKRGVSRVRDVGQVALMSQPLKRREKMFTAKEKKMIRENVVADKIIFKADGTVKFKHGYFYRFYRHGRTPEKHAEIDIAAMKKIGFDMIVHETRDEFRAWPANSYLVDILKRK